MTGIADTLLRRQVMLQRLSAGEINKFQPVLTEIDKAIRIQLSGDELTDFNRKRLESQLTAVDDLIDGTLTDYSQKLLDDLQKIAANESNFSATALSTVVDISTAIPAAVTVKAAILSNPLAARGPNSGALLKAFIENWTTAQRNAVIGAIRMGVFQGKPNAEIVRAIRGTAARKYADGLLDVTARQAAAVVHTAIQHVSSVARQTVFDQNADIIAKVQWLSTLDRRTCLQCASLDGQEFDIDKGPRPPAHPNCRCTMIPVLAGKYAKFNGFSTRASSGSSGGKQVAADLTYYDWLKTQNAAFQDLAIGPVRAKLFRDGGISANRFAELQLDKNFAPLTLAEMKALDPTVFANAGIKP